MPVELLAVVVVVMIAAPWQRTEVTGLKALMVTVAVIVTT